jgi:glycosyltransferase involved in cell wall biosynthesis
MPRPIVSVLIPTRNRGAYLSYAIRSAINIPDEDVEIIVSENYSHDNSLEVANSFNDKRLTVLRPDKPLPMHANWEFLLSKSTGEWIYFLGDDDAMMPHAASYLRYITKKYPACEALVTPRAYYFWKSANADLRQFVVKAEFSDQERWIDSKKFLDDLLDAKVYYLYGPQNYSGGFQRRSLVKRVLNAQNGVYFKSVTPDAYGALMGCVHTYRYLQTGFPVAWVGTSDSKHATNTDGAQSKDRTKDFFGLHDEDDLVIHRALGELKAYSFPLVFYEAYLSAIPTTSYRELNRARLLMILTDAKEAFESKSEGSEFSELLDFLGFDLLEIERECRSGRHRKRIERNLDRFMRYSHKIIWPFSRRCPPVKTSWSQQLESNSYLDYPNILTANEWVQAVVEDYLQECIGSNSDTFSQVDAFPSNKNKYKT